MPHPSRSWLHAKSSKGLIWPDITSGLQVSGRDRSVENWTWGLALIALTVGIHASGIVSMALVLHSIGIRVESQRLGLRRVFVILIGLIGAVGLLLAVLHGIEAGLWAAAYWWLSALASREEAILYSVDSLTTRGASGLVLAQHWRMMGALESVDGMLLFGISTAFMFAVIQKYWPLFESRGDPH